MNKHPGGAAGESAEPEGDPRSLPLHPGRLFLPHTVLPKATEENRRGPPDGRGWGAGWKRVMESRSTNW